MSVFVTSKNTDSDLDGLRAILMTFGETPGCVILKYEDGSALEVSFDNVIPYCESV